MYTGFSNERSAEYVILNDLYQKLNANFSFFYPVWFHKRRDDTSISYSNKTRNLRLVACFSRRIKTDYIHSEKSLATWRESHFRQCHFFKENDTSTITAVPIGSSIEEIGFGAYCQWFEISSNGDFSEENVHFLYQKIFESETERIRGVNEIELFELLANGKVYSWNEILDLLRKWYQEFIQSTRTNLFHFYSGQKPIFIVYRLN